MLDAVLCSGANKDLPGMLALLADHIESNGLGLIDTST